MALFAELPPPPDPFGSYPEYAGLKERFLAAASCDDWELLEQRFLELYCHLHGHEAAYTAAERERVTATGGYWCHAGGISPILLAGPYVRPETVLADFGAGNGLQGLLIQALDPHAKTVQIEISSRMVEAGKELQAWLRVPEDRVTWHVGDVLDFSPAGFDFIYLYRPVRPAGEGLRFYQRFGADLAGTSGVVIFSVADCLGPFLPERFRVIHADGHLTCYQGD